MLNNIVTNKKPAVNDLKASYTEEFASKFPFIILFVEDYLINQKLATKLLSKLAYTSSFWWATGFVLIWF